MGQLILPFPTDQFSNGADLEGIGAASVLSPKEASAEELALAIKVGVTSDRRLPSKALSPSNLVEAVFG